MKSNERERGWALWLPDFVPNRLAETIRYVYSWGKRPHSIGVSLIYGMVFAGLGLFFFRQWLMVLFSFIYSFAFTFVAPVPWLVKYRFAERIPPAAASAARVAIAIAFNFAFLALLFAPYFYLTLRSASPSITYRVVGSVLLMNLCIFSLSGWAISRAMIRDTELLNAFKRESKLEDLATQAQLAALRTQLNPHFLFNALNSVAALIPVEPDRAERCVELLSQVLRHCLQNKQWVSLEEELEFLKAYLEIEQVRFGQRLKVEWDIDPAALAERVPSMLLQPLVENSIKHGVGARESGGTVRIDCRFSGPIDETGNASSRALRIKICDTGPGIPGATLEQLHTSERVGLRNVRERLTKLYGSDFEPQFERPAGGGTVVTLRIPVERGSATLERRP